MPTLRQTASLRLSAVNIVIVNSEMHTPMAYARLIRAFAKLETAVKARGEQFLEMDSVLTTSEPSGMLYGTLHRFTALDAMNWYNTEKHRRATDAERSQIRVPSDIAANYREIPFAVDLKSHTMVFPTKSSRTLVSPIQVENFVTRLSANPEIYSNFGEVTATIEQDDQELQRILTSGSIKMLKLTVKRPNESFRKYDKPLFERLKRIRAKSVSEEYYAEDKDGIKPDEELVARAASATSNGEVNARVVVDGLTEEFSTKDMPIQERVTYDAQKENLLIGFRRGIKQILKRIKSKNKDG